MGVAFQTTEANQIVTVPAGTHVGHILVAHTGCTIRGAGIGVSTVRLDGTYAEGVRPGASVATCTIEDLTIDADQNATVAAVLEIGGGIARMTATRVEVLDHAVDCIAVYNRDRVTLNDCRIVGSGAGALHYTGATSTVVRGATVIGGRYGFLNVAADGIDLADMSTRHDYWAVPTYESVTVTAYDARGATVTSHDSDNRSSGDIMRHLVPVTTFDPEDGLRDRRVRLRDRVETADGRWTQVIDFAPDGTAVLDDWRSAGLWRPIDTPDAVATVYRVVLGRIVTAQAQRLDFQTGGTTPASPRWRHVDGSTAPTPDLRPGSRLDIIRHGAVDLRDTDTGAFHVTENARGARLTRCKAVGGASDTISLRGIGTVAEACSTDLGSDMGFTVDGANGRVTVRGCQAKRTGRTGFHLTGGPSDLYSCWAAGNGTINDGSGDYGVTTTSDCGGSTLQVRGLNNLDGLIAGHITEATPGGFERTATEPPTFADQMLQVSYGRSRGRGRR